MSLGGPPGDTLGPPLSRLWCSILALHGGVTGQARWPSPRHDALVATDEGRDWPRSRWILTTVFLAVALAGAAASWLVKGQPGWGFLGMATALAIGFVTEAVLQVRRRRSDRP